MVLLIAKEYENTDKDHKNMNLTWIHKIGRISANNGPIFKIQNLAYSVEQARSV